MAEGDPNSFHTLKTFNSSRNPPTSGSDYPALHALIHPHIDSFNAIFDDGLLDLAVAGIEPRQVQDAAGNRLRCWIEEVHVAKPMLSEKERYSLNRLMKPRECRERGVSYRGRMTAKLVFTVNGGPVRTETRALGHLPVMVRSTKCHLGDASSAELVAAKEDADELGGYFIVNGIERIIRLLIVTRRNHPLALIRPSFAKRGPQYTHYGCQMRCIRPDETSQTIYLQYCQDGSCMVRFSYRKNEYLMPLMLVLRALVDTDDRAVMEALVQGDWQDTFMTGRVEAMLRDFKRYVLVTRRQCREYIGARFHVVFGMPKETAYDEVGTEFLRRLIMVHLASDRDKFNALILMTRKLYALVGGRCCADNPDSPMHQELLLPGHLFLAYLREKLDDWLAAIQAVAAQEVRRSAAALDLSGDLASFHKLVNRVPADIGKKMEYFLATGNLVSNTGLDLQQTSGYTVVAEKLNFLRYLSHFRSVHRGAFFAELKTTTVRKLLPEAWGFLCPVHTPDGAPCGLLNHLAHCCVVPVRRAVMDDERLEALLVSLGMLSIDTRQPNHLPVVIDGRWVGVVPSGSLDPLALCLRHLRATASDLPEMLEIAAIPPSNGGLHPGLHLFTTPARFMRPVEYLGGSSSNGDRSAVHVGSLEQVYLDIAIHSDDLAPSTLYREEAPTNVLSVIANMTPFCDFNQSPRNMYQCQMGKQSMGTPAHALPHRTDNKLYRLTTGQSPIVRPRLFNRYGFEGYPNGTNAVVAVISYTGYDMEDAMILNKSAYERGFKHGAVYKSEHYDIVEGRPKDAALRFGLTDRRLAGKTIDADGLPIVGARIRPDDPLFSVIDDATGTCRIERYKAFEDAIIDEVRLLGDDTGDAPLQRIHIKFRIPRNPVIGDKFSSRHGQKGVCSQRWPLVDMPWSESGLTPDIIINPHAFPSRMTIGMFVESMAAKAGALHGIAQDATAFQFDEQCSAADYFGEQLRLAGYNYHGNEPMYSGVTGHEMRVDIYIGVVFYQRLRHMVSDKFQVRTTGPVHNLTQQPVKGRKRAGGIRFGEMERDSLLAHGAAFMLQDRLMNCSDRCQTWICRRCGSILSPVTLPSAIAISGNDAKTRVACHACNRADAIERVALPFVFRYLAAELMAMNINMRLDVK